MGVLEELQTVTLDVLVGPIRNIAQKPFGIPNFYNALGVGVLYVGVSRAGKNQSIKEVVYTLGGVYQEVEHYQRKTLRDRSYVFGVYEDQLVRVALCSNPGHLEKHVLDVKPEFTIVVLKYIKASTFSRQIRKLPKLLYREDLPFESYPVLVTRVDDPGQIPKRRFNQLAGRNCYFVDNRPKRRYGLDNLRVQNVDILLDVVRRKYPGMRLVYFGGDNIPSSLADKIVRHSGQVQTAALASDEAEKAISPEARLLETIFYQKKDIKF